MIANNILIFLLVIINCIASITFAFQISYYHPRHRLSSHLATSSFTTSTHHHFKSSSPKLLLDSVDEIITSQSQSVSISTNDILNIINVQHEQDVLYAKSSTLPFENDNISLRSSSDSDGYSRSLIEYETIQSNEQQTIAIQTNQPILNIDEIKLLTNAACESYWNRNEEDMQSSKSRFTYQRKGNSEAHLSDIVQYHTSQKQHQQSLVDTSDLQCSSVEHLVNDLLLNRIYPWVRTAYLSNEEDISVDELELYVYDSLFIRYNATEANIDSQLIDEGSQESRESVEAGQERRTGAGQPLHRDLGYVSINIMLNSQDEFEGGGTFFENQLLPMMMPDDKSSDQFYKAEVQPLKPRGVGHAIAHYSSNRHAGAATLQGVRDILVMFLSATPKQSTTQSSSSSIRMERKQQLPPKWELNARIKSAARTYCTTHCSNNIEEQILCRILHHRLAIDQVGDDGEAWHYLGMALLDYYNHQVESSSNEAADIKGTLELAISCLHMASEYTPCDGRLYNNLGIALERQQSSSSSTVAEDLHSEIVSAYERSIMIHSKCESVGCDVGADYESACLNYGLYLSKLDLFYEAIDVLSRIVGEKAEHQSVVNENELDAAGWARLRVRQDAEGLLSFCKKTGMSNVEDET